MRARARAPISFNDENPQLAFNLLALCSLLFAPLPLYAANKNKWAWAADHTHANELIIIDSNRRAIVEEKGGRRVIIHCGCVTGVRTIAARVGVTRVFDTIMMRAICLCVRSHTHT